MNRAQKFLIDSHLSDLRLSEGDNDYASDVMLRFNFDQLSVSTDNTQTLINQDKRISELEKMVISDELRDRIILRLKNFRFVLDNHADSVFSTDNAYVSDSDVKRELVSVDCILKELQGENDE